MDAVEPEQFPLSPVHGSALSALSDHLEGHLGRSDVIEDIYPLSSVQEAMLFHAIGVGAPEARQRILRARRGVGQSGW